MVLNGLLLLLLSLLLLSLWLLWLLRFPTKKNNQQLTAATEMLTAIYNDLQQRKTIRDLQQRKVVTDQQRSTTKKNNQLTAAGTMTPTGSVKTSTPPPQTLKQQQQ